MTNLGYGVFIVPLSMLYTILHKKPPKMERNLTGVEERDTSSLLDLYSYLMEHHRDRRYVNGFVLTL
jgi:hypothetical protein